MAATEPNPTCIIFCGLVGAIGGVIGDWVWAFAICGAFGGVLLYALPIADTYLQKIDR